MQNRKGVILLVFILGVVCSFARAQNTEAVMAYIARYKDLAIAEMQRTGVPASITLAQGIHETEAGTSDLVVKSNNHFGIKCKSGWLGESVSHDDDARGECFRKYDAPSDSYKDHSDFLRGSQRYAFLFSLDPTDYEAWCYGLKKAGYATNPKYSQILIKLIKDYNLQDYTMIAMGKMKDLNENTGMVVAASNTVSNEEEKNDVMPAVVYTINYPDGEFKINGTRVVFAKKGTSYLTIAEQHEIGLARLFDFNDMKEQEVTSCDQLLYIQRKRKTGENESHTVLKGETMYSICQVEGIRLESLLEFNGMKPGMEPAAGETLSLRSRSSSTPRLAEAEKKFVRNEDQAQEVERNTIASRDIVMHRVRAKETIYSIARKYNVSYSDIVSWNHLQRNDLRIGQSLKIYR